MALYVNPYEFIQPLITPPVEAIQRGVGQGIHLARLGEEIPILRAEAAMKRAQMPYADTLAAAVADKAKLDALRARTAFTALQGWSYGISVYYSVITLTTIGFGDYVAGNIK